jgi:hypothetical protein
MPNLSASSNGDGAATSFLESDHVIDRAAQDTIV